MRPTCPAAALFGSGMVSMDRETSRFAESVSRPVAFSEGVDCERAFMQRTCQPTSSVVNRWIGNWLSRSLDMRVVEMPSVVCVMRVTSAVASRPQELAPA